jgi:hypothetical protein
VSESRKENKNEKERRAYAFDEVETPLVVVEGDGVPILETLRFVFLLLEHEDVVVEVLLERLVGEVDAQLLEAVFLLLAAGTVRPSTKMQTFEARRTVKFSNPKMSKMPMNGLCSVKEPLTELLICSTSQPNSRS